MQEEAHPHHEGYIAVEESVESGENIRRSGDDGVKDEIVLPSGGGLGAAQLGMAAAVGLSQLTVHPRPRAGVLVTGAAIIEPGRPLRAGQIYGANRYSLSALVTRARC